MNRLYKRLESKQQSTGSSDSSSSSSTRDEEVGERRKGDMHLQTSVTSAATFFRSKLSVTIQKLCLLVIVVLAITNITNQAFSSSMPRSVRDFLEQEQQNKGKRFSELGVGEGKDTMMFYSSQSVDLRYCNSSIGANRNGAVHRGAAASSAEEENMSIIIYAGESRHDHPGFNNFISSLTITGFKHISIVEPPASTREINQYTRTNYTGEAKFWKERLTHFYHKTLDFPPEAILIFCDAFDTLFTQPPSTLLRRFRLFESDIVFSTEVLCDTISCRRDLALKDFFVSVAEKSNPYKFINAGMFMGKAAALGKFLHCALGFASGGRDDQTAFSHCYHHFYNAFKANRGTSGAPSPALTVKLDYDSFLFGNLPPVSSLFEQSWDFQTSRADAEFEIFEIPFLYRKHARRTPLTKYPLYYSPVAIHFPGIAYRPSLHYQWFNPCQQFLKWRYNEIGQTLFKSGRIPNLAYGFISKHNRRDVTDSEENELGDELKYEQISESVEEEELLQPEAYEAFQTSCTLFDINEVSARNHQEAWLSAFYLSSSDSSFIAQWRKMKQQAENISQLSSPDVDTEPLVHVFGTMGQAEHKVGSVKKISRLSRLFLEKIDSLDSHTDYVPPLSSTFRRLQSAEDNDTSGEIQAEEEGFGPLIGSLFKQTKTSLQPERIILIETVEASYSLEEDYEDGSNLPDVLPRNLVKLLSQYLIENLNAIYKSNVYWKPDKIVFRVKLSHSLAHVFETSRLEDVENDVLGIMQAVMNITNNVHVVCSVHANLDSKFFGILKHEDSDAIFVLLEKNVIFFIVPAQWRDEQRLRYPQNQLPNTKLGRTSVDMKGSLPISLPVPQVYLDTLLKTFLRTPTYAYGFSGFFVERKDNSQAPLAIEETESVLVLRSTNHLVDKAPIPVDVLNLRGGLVFRRRMLYMLRNDFDFVDSMSNSPGCLCDSESLLVSAILSRNRVPRVHVPHEGVFDVAHRSNYAPGRGRSNAREDDQEKLSQCLACLLPTLQRDWIDPRNMYSTQSSTRNSSSSSARYGLRHGPAANVNAVHSPVPSKVTELILQSSKKSKVKSMSTCDTPTFQELPNIDNLPGFSFQYNWDPLSATSPCTQHLYTRFEESGEGVAGILGAGQFMTEHQRLFSPAASEDGKPPFMIRLETGARLCSYKLIWHQGNISSMRVMSCLLPPASVASERIPHYAAITEGELCFYTGAAPHFGGTRQESAHRELVWCTSPAEMNLQAFDGKKQNRTPDSSFSLGKDRFGVVHTSAERTDDNDGDGDGDDRALSQYARRSLRKGRNDVGELVKRTFKKRSHDVIMHRVQGKCILRIIPPDQLLSIYLHVNIKGVFGLYVSMLFPPYDLAKPSDRIASLRLARCFKRFE